MDNYKIKVGDTLYQPDVGYWKVFRIVIEEMWFERYLSGWKTITRGRMYADDNEDSCWGTKEFFFADITAMYRTREEAESWLSSKKSEYPEWSKEAQSHG